MTKKFSSLSDLKNFYISFIENKSSLIKVNSNPNLDKEIIADNGYDTDVQEKLIEIINNSLQEAILVEVIHSEPEINHVDEVLVEINQSNIYFQKMFTQISLKDICEEGLASISEQVHVSFNNHQKSKSLLQRWYKPNLKDKSSIEKFNVKIGSLFQAELTTWVVMSIFRKAYNKWRPTENCKVPVDKKGLVLIHCTLAEHGALNGSYILPYQNAEQEEINKNKKMYFMKIDCHDITKWLAAD